MRLDPQALIQTALASNAGIETLERLAALAKDVRATQAREAWFQAIAEFQRTCPTIRKIAGATIRTQTGGSYSYRYAPLDHILSVILPVMGPLGMSVSWRTTFEKDRACANCIVSHDLGHSEESGPVAIPITGYARASNPAQSAAAALTYAKRYSLLAIIGMAPEDDVDANTDAVVDLPQQREPDDRRAVDDPPAQSSVDTTPTPPPDDGAIVTWRGKILDVTSKKTSKGTTRYGIKGTIDGGGPDDVVWFNTFSDTEADKARSFVGQVAIIDFVWNKGFRNVHEVLQDPGL